MTPSICSDRCFVSSSIIMCSVPRSIVLSVCSCWTRSQTQPYRRFELSRINFPSYLPPVLALLSSVYSDVSVYELVYGVGGVMVHNCASIGRVSFHSWFTLRLEAWGYSIIIEIRLRIFSCLHSFHKLEARERVGLFFRLFMFTIALIGICEVW